MADSLSVANGGMQMNYTETLARWATGSDGLPITDAVLDKASEFLLDWFGTAFAGSAQKAASMLYPIVRENAPDKGPSTVLNKDLDTMSPLWAAFQNGF